MGKNRINLLGIVFHINLAEILKLNCDKKLVKIKNTINICNKRNMTALGRFTGIKTLLISQLNHLFIALPNPTELNIKDLNSTLYKFLWNSPVEKDKRNIVT